MFETETMAELYVKQGLLAKALDLYNRLLTSAEDEITRARRRQRIGEVEQLLATGAPTPPPLPATPATPPRAAPPAKTTAPASARAIHALMPSKVAPAPAAPAPPRPLPMPGVRAEWDRRRAVILWRLPADTVAPALDLLLVLRTAAGILTERRTMPLESAEGRTLLAIPDLHSVRVAAGRMEGTRFLPIVRATSDS